MPFNAFVSRGSDTPQPITIEFGDRSIELTDLRGEVEEIAYPWLKIREDRGASIIVGRKWATGFRLHLNGEAAHMARDALHPVPWLKRAGRWALASPKAALVLLALPFLVIDSLPSTWIAQATPAAIANGIEATAIGEVEKRACDSASGNAALKSLVAQVAVRSGESRAMVVKEPSFIVSARPGGEVLVYQSAIAEVESNVLAAMVAHAMAHQRAGHLNKAVARGEGADYLARLTVFRFDRNLVHLSYSRQEEAEADRWAIAALRNAGISLKPAADFFARIDQAKLEARYWAQEYAKEHPGVPNRAKTWAAAASLQNNSRAALGEQQADALFNICWERPSYVAAKWEEPSN